MTRMAHRILLAVEAALVGATTAATLRRDQVDEIPRGQLPALDINGRGEGLEESVQRVTMDSPALQRHELRFTIAPLTGNADPQVATAAARSLAGEVESILLASDEVVVIDGTPIELAYLAVTENKAGDTADALTRTVMTWQATFHTLAGQPGVPV